MEKNESIFSQAEFHSTNFISISSVFYQRFFKNCSQLCFSLLFFFFFHEIHFISYIIFYLSTSLRFLHVIFHNFVLSSVSFHSIQSYSIIHLSVYRHIKVLTQKSTKRIKIRGNISRIFVLKKIFLRCNIL